MSDALCESRSSAAFLRPGDASLLINGEPHCLRLTLGALAELESVLGDGDFDAMMARLKRPSVGDLLIVLQALLRGGGRAPAVDALRASDIDVAAASRAVAEAFAALGGDGSLQKEDEA